MTDSKSIWRIHPAYRDCLLAAVQSCSHEGVLDAEPGLVLVQSSYRRTKMMVLVDPSNHVIKKAAHHGASSAVQRGLLDALCAILVGMTMQEASDHSVIHLEHRVRNHSKRPPVPGIVTPENADPAFRVPLLLIRKLLVRYRRATGYASVENFYDSPPSPEWLALTTDEKLQRLREAFNVLCSDLPPQDSDVEIVRIDDDLKVTIKFRRELADADKQSCLMLLEREIQKKIDDHLQLYTERMEDWSKKVRFDSHKR